MHCPSCEEVIRDDIAELKGVNSVNVSYTDNKVEIEFDESIIDEKKIKEVIKKAGYEVE